MSAGEGMSGPIFVESDDSRITFDLLGPADYDRAKAVLNKARHPGFVGRELFFRCATAGTCTIAILNGADVGLALVAKDKLQALSVVTSAQGAGVGSRLIARVQPRWVNAIGERVAWFEKRGYRSIGAAHVGQNGKHATQLMERAAGQAETATQVVAKSLPEHPAPEEAHAPSFFDMREDSRKDQVDGELAILDGLLQKAILAERFDCALKIVEAAQKTLHRRRTG